MYSIGHRTQLKHIPDPVNLPYPRKRVLADTAFLLYGKAFFKGKVII